MERKKRFTFMTLLLAFSLSTLSAQYKQEIYNAYITNNMEVWKATVDEMEAKEKKSDELLLELINYQYGYIGWSLGNNEKKQAKEYLKLAEDNLKRLEKTSLYPSYVDAYKSAFYGYTIGLNKLKAPFVGPKSINAAKKSMEENPNNPYGYIQYANAQFYMPPVFGGSKTEALEYYKQAQTIMEKDSVDMKNDWNYLSLLTNMAEAYTEIKEYKKAEQYFKYILKIEPNFFWVKNELYPNFIKNKNK
jgi:tetratricopeptide (TPR) repeat protein